MPRYDFRCRTCGATFEVARPLSAADEPTSCPDGHADTVKLMPVVSVGGRATAPATARSGGGCCGGACGCG